MSRFLVLIVKLIAIALTPIAVIGFVVSKRAISGDQYVAALELFGNASRRGAFQIFSADISTISSVLNFFETWSLPVLLAIVLVGIALVVISKNRVDSTWHICLGLFISFGIWAVGLTRMRQMFNEIVGSTLSGLSARVINAYLSKLCADLLNLTGLLALIFGAITLGFWVLANRRKVSASKLLN
jgi:hypothetical protein